MASVHDVADYIIVKIYEPNNGLSLLKLQKLVYYVQAWHLALAGTTMFEGKFQAWVHGPVNRSLYDRFSATHLMYDPVNLNDVRENFDQNALSEPHRLHIDEVLDAYAQFSGPQLERMTHEEKPWLDARGCLKPSERCESEIDENLMKTYYKELLAQA
ncbi:MAG: DUF4065 domain-containing protein [Methylococcaceae bacterium]|nr:DUF4065 domain-containing protein [Methylococcaceae bacterium]